MMCADVLHCPTRTAALGPCFGTGARVSETPSHQLRRGLTLIELLVVITIMMILAAFVLPKFQLSSKTRKIREAARLVNVYFGVARTRAIETGRPCGVMFKRMETEPNGSNTLFQVEVPPPYAGDLTSARAVLQYPSTAVLTAQLQIAYPDLVKTGDKIQFNGQGPWYTVLSSTATGGTGNYPVTLSLEVAPAYQGHLPWPEPTDNPSWSDPVTFRIQRQPVATMAPPVTLPTDTVVDLSASGTGTKPVMFSTAPDPALPTGPVTVMFSPNGMVSKLYWTYNDGTSKIASSEVPTEPIFFLIGKQAQLGVGPADNADADPETMANWQILTNLWVTVSPQTGLVSVSENAATPDWYADPDSDDATKVQNAIDEARTFAKQSKNMGGR